MAIRFHFQKETVLRSRRPLKQFISDQVSLLRFDTGDIDFVFCSDEDLLRINREFLAHDYYTDIISFDYSDNKNKVLHGEIYISVDRVTENASSMKVYFQEELHRVIFHGVLHFCGFRDKSKLDRRKMREMEDKWLKRYFG
jgi:probable rRNA maturation factor